MSAPKLTVATTFPVHPPRGGGQQRVFELYRALAALGWRIELITLGSRHERAARRAIAPGVDELRIPRTPEFEGREFALQQRSGVPMSDIALGLHHDLVPAYGAAIAESARDATAVVACHPYPLGPLRAGSDAPLLYEAQDVEADLKAAVLGDSDDLLAEVEAVEAACCAQSALVYACSEQDAARLRERYGVEPERLAVVANGVDLGARPFVDLEARAARKAPLGLAGRTQALFIGSWHEPNLVAVRDIVAAAPDLPDLHFLVVGSAGLALTGELPDNVDVCGVVDAGFIEAVLELADVALNPMRSGSGTNLKMLDYAAAGVPLASTTMGARGLGMEAGRHYAEIGEGGLVPALLAFAAESPATVRTRTEAARARVEAAFDWRAIAATLAAHPAVRELTAVAA